MQIDELDPNRIPAHVAVVMDGNGRWAQKRGLARTDGHAAGEEALFDTVEGALQLGISDLTVYAFSTENWKRPVEEVRFLLGFNESLLVRRAGELHERGVRVRFIGRRDRRVPKRLVNLIESTEQLTADDTRMTLRIAFNYGGQTELVDAARRLSCALVRALVILILASPVIPRYSMTSAEKLAFPAATNPTMAMATSSRGKIDRKAVKVTAEAR